MPEQNRPFGEVSSLTSGKSITTNTVWSVLGIVLPLSAAAISIPILIQHMGVARFGLLTILWLVLNYFSLFDLGLGQAVARMVAERIGQGSERTLPTLLATAEKSCLVLGSAGGVILFASSNFIAAAMAPTSPMLAAEAASSLRLIALVMPLVVGAMGWTGALQGIHAFRALSLIRILTGTWTFALPAAVVQWTPNLIGAAIVLTIGRAVAWLLQYWVFRRHSPITWSAWSTPDFRQFLQFGGWLTVSKVVGPLMVYFDRFVIAALLGASAVAYYSTPFEIMFRLLMFPTTLTQVLLPAMAMVGAGNRRITMTSTASFVILIGTAIVALTIVLFANPALTLWLGSDFAAKSTIVLQTLAIGLILNGIAQVPFNQLLAIGRSDVTARLHLLELLPYGAGLWWAVSHYGIEGAAITWVARAGIDVIALCWLVGNYEQGAKAPYSTLILQALAITAVLGCLVLVPLTGYVRILLVVAALVTAGVVLRPFVRTLTKKGGSGASA